MLVHFDKLVFESKIKFSCNLLSMFVYVPGPGLTFIVYPEGLAQMPIAPLWAILFFFMMATLGFSSQVCQALGLASNVYDVIFCFSTMTKRTNITVEMFPNLNIGRQLSNCFHFEIKICS